MTGTIERFRSAMEERWSAFDREAERSRDSNLTGPMWSEWYRGLSNDDRRLADLILSEWVHSPDENKQFDALGLISDFTIRSALPSLERLVDDLLDSTDPGPHFLRLKVLRLIDKLHLQSRSE